MSKCMNFFKNVFRPIRSIVVGTVLGTCIVHAPVPSFAGISMHPLRTRLAIAPGSHVSQTIVVRNNGESGVNCTIQPADWTIHGGTAAGLQYHQPGTQERSCSGWTQIWPEEFRLEKGETQEVVLSFTMPEEASGSYFSAFIIDAEPDEKKQDETGQLNVRLRVNLGHLIIVDTEDRSNWSAEIEDLSVSTPDDTRPLHIKAKIRNNGNTALRTEGSFAVIDGSGMLVDKLNIKTYLAQPGGIMELSEIWEGLLPAGQYQLLGTINLGNDQFLTPELTFEVIDSLTIDIQAVPKSEGVSEAVITINNLGNITNILTGHIDVHDTSGQLIKSIEAPELTILPGEEAEKVITLNDLPPDAAELVLHYQNTNHHLQSATRLHGQ